MTVEELWKEYRPRLKAAKELDSREGCDALLRNPMLIGPVLVYPLTLEKLMFLQAADHPALTGHAMTAEDVKSFLWVCGPDFKPNAPRLFKRFRRKFWFKNMEEISTELKEWLESEFSRGMDGGSPPPAHWIVSLVDCLASQYGWSENEIMGLALKRAFAYGSAIIARNSDKPLSFSKHADAVRHEYLLKVQEIQLAEEAK